MLIPAGNDLGHAIARPAQAPNINPRAMDGGINQAADRLGKIASNVGEQGLQQGYQEDQTAQRAQTALALAKFNNNAYDLHDQTAQAVSSGALAPDKAISTFNDALGKLKADSFTDLKPEQQQLIDDNIVTSTGSMTRSLNGVVVKRQQSDVAGTIDQFGEQVQRDAMRIGPAAAAEKFNAMVDFTGDAAGYSPEIKAKKKQAFNETVHAQFFGAAGSAAFQSGDVKAVDAVLARVGSDEGNALDPTARTTIENRLFGYRNAIQAKNDRDQAKADRFQTQRDKFAAETIGKFSDLTTSGQYASQDAIDNLTSAVAGTSYEGYAKELMAQQSAVAGFAARSSDERAAILNQARARGADPAVGTTPDGAKAVASLEKIDSAARAAVTDNPWVAAQKYGVIKDAGALDVSNVPAALQTLQARMQQLPTVEGWTNSKISPFQPKEAEQLARVLHALPPDQASTAFGQIGDALGDPQRIAAVAKQVIDKDGTLGLAMAYGATIGTTQGRLVSELILRGDKAIQDKVIKPDGVAESGWQASISKQIRGAYSNQQAEDQVVKAAFYIAAAKNGDVDNAVRLASGGIIDFNGSKVPMPFGMTSDGQSSGERIFKDRIKGIDTGTIDAQTTDGQVRAGPTLVPVDQFVKSLPDAQLVHAGQGLYNVRAGGGLVLSADGKRRITIKVTP